MAVCKLAQVVCAHSRHWSNKIINQELAADWSVGVGRYETRGCVCFLGGFELQ